MTPGATEGVVLRQRVQQLLGVRSSEVSAACTSSLAVPSPQFCPM